MVFCERLIFPLRVFTDLTGNPGREECENAVDHALGKAKTDHFGADLPRKTVPGVDFSDALEAELTELGRKCGALGENGTLADLLA